jgi:predicted HTH transcriptional regulator
MSFGGLVDGLTLEKFYEGTSMPRNREIMRIFKDLEFVEQLGSGIPKIVDKYGRNVISVSESVVQATLAFDCDMGEGTPSKHPVKHPQESPQKHPQKSSQKILAAIRENPERSMQKIADLIGLSADTVKDQIQRLKDKGAIRRVGPDKGGYWEIK